MESKLVTFLIPGGVVDSREIRAHLFFDGKSTEEAVELCRKVRAAIKAICDIGPDVALTLEPAAAAS
jgi:hypothetical protein